MPQLAPVYILVRKCLQGPVILQGIFFGRVRIDSIYIKLPD